MLGEISAAGGNVMEVMHERISPDLLLDEVEVQVQLETRGAEHSAHLVGRLRDRGYRVLE
jgi:threonine dehydratase